MYRNAPIGSHLSYTTDLQKVLNEMKVYQTSWLSIHRNEIGDKLHGTEIFHRFSVSIPI